MKRETVSHAQYSTFLFEMLFNEINIQQSSSVEGLFISNTQIVVGIVFVYVVHVLRLIENLRLIRYV